MDAWKTFLLVCRQNNPLPLPLPLLSPFPLSSSSLPSSSSTTTTTTTTTTTDNRSASSSLINQTLVISLDKNPDRYARTLQLLKEKNFKSPVVRWRAVYGAALDKKILNNLLSTRALLNLENGRDSIWDFVSLGAVGCLLSHASIWLHMVKHNIQRILVLEDDAEPIPANLSSDIDQLLKDVLKKGEFDLLMLQHSTTYGHGGKPIDEQWSELAQRSRGMGFYTCAYVVSLRGARRLLERLLPLEVPADVYMYAHARLFDDFVLLQATPQLFAHPLVNNLLSSDIGNIKWRDLPVYVPKHVSLLLWASVALLVVILIATVILLTIRYSRERKRRMKKALETEVKGTKAIKS